MNIKELGKQTKLKTAEKENPHEAQVEMSKDLTEIPVECYFPGCVERINLKTLAAHFDQHIVSYKMKKMKEKILEQKMINKDQSAELQNLQLENTKLTEELSRANKRKGKNLNLDEKRTEDEKLGMETKVIVERLSRTKLLEFSCEKEDQNKLAFCNHGIENKTQDDIEEHMEASRKPKRLKLDSISFNENQLSLNGNYSEKNIEMNKNMSNLDKLNLTPFIRIENLTVVDVNSFVSKVIEVDDRIIVKILRKRKKPFDEDYLYT